MPVAPLLFVNIGWMLDYAGIKKTDPITGGFGYFKDHDFGHEAWNFAPRQQKLWGYIPGSRGVNLRNLGAESGSTSLDGVTVVWIARHPSNGKTLIVGWYVNATVHAELRFINRAGGHDVGYRIDAPEAGSKLLLPDQRTFEIPTEKKKGNLGQSPVWYGGTDAFRARVRDYLATDGLRPASRGRARTPPRNSDPEARKKIELAAVRHATRYYESEKGGFRHVRSVERDAAGWDLTVTSPSGEVLKVEVKGCSGTDCIAELTPNEFAKMRSVEHRGDYVIYIVTQAGTKAERAHVFRFFAKESSAKSQVWLSSEGRRLRIEERVAAHLSYA